MYYAELPTVADQSIPLRAGAAVTAGIDGYDMVVCWPPSTEALDPTGWTLGGEPAHAVLPITDSCALVVRDTSRSMGFNFYSDEDRPAYWAMARVKIPGLGPYLVALSTKQLEHENEPLRLEQQLVSLSDRRLVSESYLYGPGGIRLGGARHGLGAYEIGSGIAGPAGDGVWIPVGQTLRLINED